MLGNKIREIRIQKGKTIKEVAEAIGLTQSYLSQVERDLLDPSLASLRKIAKAINVPIYYFLADEVSQYSIIRKDERRILELPHSSLKYEFATPFTLTNNQTPNMVTILYKLTKEDEPENVFSHDAEEFVFILRGKMRITIGSEAYVLEEGDSAYIEKNVPHKFETIDGEETEGISVLSPSIY